MDLLILVLVLCVIGFVIYLLTTHVPMPPAWATAINILSLIALLLYALTRVVPLPNLLTR